MCTLRESESPIPGVPEYDSGLDSCHDIVQFDILVQAGRCP